MKVICDYCKADAALVTGKELYPHRPDLFEIRSWLCRPCNASVGVHRGTIIPLGRLAKKELKALKMAAHKAFDPFWKIGPMKRKEAYRWLSKEMGISEDECHIGMFDEKKCHMAIRICKGISK